VEEPTQVAGLTPAQYADLFDRMRAGFKLDDHPEEHGIDQQLDWFASNPEYMQRAFGARALPLHIVTQLEARGMPLEIALLPVVESAFEPYAYSAREPLTLAVHSRDRIALRHEAGLVV